MSITSMMPSNHLILCHPFLLPPSVFPSITVFYNLSIRWPKYWSFSFSISPSNEYSGLISFRMDWLDLLAVQGTQTRVQESSPTPQFKSINSLSFSLFYSPTLTSIHEYWKNQNFDSFSCNQWSCSVMFDSLRSHGLWPTRLLHPWNFPGNSTGVGCHFLLQKKLPKKKKWSRSVVSYSLWPHGL